MPEYQIPLILSSDTNSGASQVSQNGSRFTVVFTRPLIVPHQSTQCWLTCEASTLIFNTPNITTANNKIRVQFDDTITPATYDLELDPGLYDLEHLNSSIQRALSNAGGLVDGVTLIPDVSTEKVVIKYRQFYQIDWTISGSFREILGYDSRISPVGGFSPTDDFYESGDNPAAFNQILYYLVHSDLCSGHGIRINNEYQDVIQQVPITVAAGSQISYEPRNLQKINCQNLIGQSLRELNCWLTNDSNEFVDTVGETWSTRVNIHYIVP